MTEEIIFYCKAIYLNDQPITIDSFSDIFSTDNHFSLQINKVLHNFFLSQDNNYILFYTEYGSSLPRPEHVLNTITYSEEVNPRRIDQIEPKQLFLVIDLNNSTYWSSNLRKANIIIDFFTSFGKRCDLKNIYNSSEFINNIKSINGIKLSSSPELLFNSHSLSKNLTQDIHGYGANVATLQFGYTKDRFLDSVMRKKFEELFSERASFSTFIISGRDDLGMDYVFNSEIIVKRITISIQETLNQFYNSEDVFKLFLGEL